MKEFIDEFGKNNLMIIFWIVVIVVAILILIVLIEKIQSKRKFKKNISKEIDNCIKDRPSRNIDSSLEEVNEKVVSDDVSSDDEIVYVKSVPSVQEAKEKLEEVTKKLITEDSNLIEHTHFETEQEEKSIISYEELLNASHDIDEKNDKLLEDEGEAAITLEELYRKHVDEQDVVSQESFKDKVNNPEFVGDEEKKFKNSEVISPVFGFYSGRVKQEMEKDEYLESLDNVDKPRDIETEIEKTEEFLAELRRLRNKLD